MSSIWEVRTNANMKVFSQLFVAYGGNSKPNKANAPLAFATPYEDNAAGRKRQETAKNWGSYGKDCFTEIIDNVPRPGFKITDDIKRVYYGGGNVVWRVEDPHGFEVEIQSNNLMAIIQTAGIGAGGEIPGNCLWGRENGINILLHETSSEYKTAILAAETIKPPKKIGTAIREVGKVYRLENDDLVIYAGTVHVCDWVGIRDENDGSGSKGKPTEHSVYDGTYSGYRMDYKVTPSRKMDVVIRVDKLASPNCRELVRPRRVLVLYTKAPLIEQLDADVENMPALTREYFESILRQGDGNYRKDVTYASAKFENDCAAIASISLEPIPDPQIKLKAWDEHDFQVRFDKMVEDNRYVTKKYGGSDTNGLWKHRPTLSGLLHGIYDVAVINGRTIGSIERYETNNRFVDNPSSADSVQLGGPAEIFGQYQQRSSAQRQNYGYNQYGRGNNGLKINPFVKMQDFNHVDERSAYAKSLYDQRVLFKLVIA